MRCRFRPIFIAGIASLPALLLPAGREAFAQQINLSATRGLDFGRFVAGSGGTVTVTPAGSRPAPTGGVILLTSPTISAATFSLSKSGSGNGGGKSVIISLPPDGSVRLSSGNNSMALGSFVTSPASLLSLSTIATTLSVGATLTVGANQPPGTYSGSIPLTINFQ